MIRKLFTALGILAFLSVAALFAVNQLSHSKIVCQLANSGDVPVIDVTIDGPGIRSVLGDLNPSETRRVVVRPNAHAGGVSVSYTQPDGTRRTEFLVGYIEANSFGGRIELEFVADGAMRVRSNTVNLRLLPGLVW